MSKLFYLLSLLLIIILGIYLNRSYARIYSLFEKTTNPNTSLDYTIGPKNTTHTVRYAALGDSLTAGVGAEKEEGSWPYLLATKMSDKNTKIKLFNLGQPGAKAIDVLNQQLVPLASFHPDLITLFIGTNDVHNRINLEAFKNTYTNILNQLATFKETEIILINIPYLGADKLILPPYRWYFNRKIQKYNSIINNLATERNIKIIDLYSYSQLNSKPMKNEQDKFYSIDLFHPSTYGYVLWSEIIYANLH